MLFDYLSRNLNNIKFGDRKIPKSSNLLVQLI